MAIRYKGGGKSQASATTLCQKCLKRGHYSYECTASQQDRPYQSRPSRTQQLLNPKLVPKITEAAPPVEPAEKSKATRKDGTLKRSSDDLTEMPRKRSRSSSYSTDANSVSTISTNRSRSRSRSPPKGRRSSPERRTVDSTKDKGASSSRYRDRDDPRDRARGSRSRSSERIRPRRDAAPARSRSRSPFREALTTSTPAQGSKHPAHNRDRSPSPYSKRLEMPGSLR